MSSRSKRLHWEAKQILTISDRISQNYKSMFFLIASAVIKSEQPALKFKIKIGMQRYQYQVSVLIPELSTVLVLVKYVPMPVVHVCI